MPQGTSDALMGLGMSAQLAATVGGNPSILTTAGTTQGTAAIMKTKNVELLTAGSQTGAIPPSVFPVMEEIMVVCPTATSGVVYVPSGHTLLGTLNGSFTLAQNKAAIMWQYKPKFWAYVVLA